MKQMEVERIAQLIWLAYRQASEDSPVWGQLPPGVRKHLRAAARALLGLRPVRSEEDVC